MDLHRGYVSNLAIALSAILAFSSNAFAGRILFVDDDAASGGDGTSWDTAYRFLQDALTDAAGGGISEIHVAQGIYKPDRDEDNPNGTGNRTATFQLINALAIMGGYAGIGAKDPNARDIELYETILSGDLLGNDKANFVNYQENSLHVMTGDASVISAILDGLVIISGNADNDDEEFDENGGGLLCIEGDTTINDCRFQGNRSEDFGGAVFLWDNYSSFTNCSFLRNETDGPSASGRGGAVAANRAPSFTNCHFQENFALSQGGALRGYAGSDMSIINCTFINNTAADGGACWNSADPTFVDCNFYNNQATNRGGAIVSGFGGEPEFINCEFVSNHALEGGAVTNGINIGGAYAKFLNCLFAQNSADERGGAVYNWDNGYPSQPNITSFINCVFTGNTSEEFGGAISTESWVTLHHTTISQNLAALNGGGIYMQPIHQRAQVITSNSIYWGNTDSNQGSEWSQIYVADNDVYVNYCCIQGLSGNLGGIGNIGDNPLFVDPNGLDDIPGTEDDNLRLLTGSSCIDAGNNWGVPVDADDYDEDGILCELFPVDMDGNPRFNADESDFDPGCGIPVVVDMGAYEYQFDPVDQVTFADLNGDGAVSTADLLSLLSEWGTCDGCCLADFEIDGFVGTSDLLILLANWGPCP